MGAMCNSDRRNQFVGIEFGGRRRFKDKWFFYLFFYIYIYIYIFIYLATSSSMQDLNSPTGDQTRAPCKGSAGS